MLRGWGVGMLAMLATGTATGAQVKSGSPVAPVPGGNTANNATTQADDAFGKSIGNERTGIYNPNDVRGFSPSAAGNIRLEGLYFDQQGSLTDRLANGSTVRVGLSAQGYPFPAPTGIAEFALRKAGDTLLLSPQLNYGPFGGWSVSLDSEIPIIAGRLGVAAGIGYTEEQSNFGGTPRFLSIAVMPRWRPAPGIEILPFYSRIDYRSEEAQPLVAPAGAFFPPEVARKTYYGQSWAVANGTVTNFGVAASLLRGPWTLRGGIFRSVNDAREGYADLFVDARPDGTANEIIVANAPSKFASTSGELRLSRDFIEGDRRHTIIAMIRAREQTRAFGQDVVELGPRLIGVPRPVAKPLFEFGIESHDRINQTTAGVAYAMTWRDVGEFSVGVQKTDYSKASDRGGSQRPTAKDAPYLPNATAALRFGDDVIVYAGFTRGLEESPLPPSNAVNINEAPPAIRTRQLDAGIRWAIRPNLKFVAGVFEVTKPFFDLDPANEFREVGEVRNRGVELSLAGNVAAGLNIVAGTVFLDPQVSGEARDRGEIGRQPVAAILRNSFASADYRFPNSGFSIDAVFESTGRRVANQDNTLYVPPRSVVSLGGRYRFRVGDAPVTVRAQVGNIFDNYGLGVSGGGLLVYNLPRRVLINIAADI
ncbi:TonB-dependent receptor domain-containing protein [Sandarakinorhabdus sp. DWP1-3-1]|uniref:TonB-dependent receptor domain-containing protein n=1 Tax=Sandarakinorhabdus sp. DWP1-3-1 TaxID=2804627 RepID=UPI003CFB6064